MRRKTKQSSSEPPLLSHLLQLFQEQSYYQPTGRWRLSGGFWVCPVDSSCEGPAAHHRGRSAFQLLGDLKFQE